MALVLAFAFVSAGPLETLRPYNGAGQDDDLRKLREAMEKDKAAADATAAPQEEEPPLEIPVAPSTSVLGPVLLLRRVPLPVGVAERPAVVRDAQLRELLALTARARRLVPLQVHAHGARARVVRVLDELTEA